MNNSLNLFILRHLDKFIFILAIVVTVVFVGKNLLTEVHAMAVNIPALKAHVTLLDSGETVLSLWPLNPTNVEVVNNEVVLSGYIVGVTISPPGPDAVIEVVHNPYAHQVEVRIDGELHIFSTHGLLAYLNA